MTNLNTYQCVSKPTVTNTVTITEWLNQIKSSDYSQLIESARAGLIDYNSTKASLPCCTYNFLYNKYKKDVNIISSTGYLYIDIDDSSFDISSLDLTKIFSYYHSFGGKGYSIIVQVEGVTKSNFKSTYLSICNDLGISSFIDVNAIKHSQFNVLSFDTNIYINESSFVFNSVESSITKTPQPLYNNQLKKEHIRGVGVFSENVKYNNLYEFQFNGYDSISNWNEGFNFIECYQPFYKLQDKRKRSLLSYLTNLVWLNPNLDYFHYVNIMESVNKRICETPIPSNLIVGMVKSVLKQEGYFLHLTMN